MGWLRAASVVIAALAGPAQADWAARAGDSGGLIYGSAYSARAMAISCTAPSPAGRPLIETGDHETRQTPPYQMLLELSTEVADPLGTSFTLTTAMLIVDGLGYRLPPLEYSDFDGGWTLQLPLADQLFLALLQAQTVILDPGRGQQFDLGRVGLAESLRTAVSSCIAGWERQGVPTPAGLEAWRAPGSTPAATDSGGIRARAEAAIRDGCGGGYREDGTPLLFGDIDGDGADDVVVDWRSVRCTGTLPRPFCGASMCSADVYLTSTPQKDEFLALGVSLVPLSNGRMGVQTGGSLASCSQYGLTGCDFIWYWTGTGFAEIQGRSP